MPSLKEHPPSMPSQSGIRCCSDECCPPPCPPPAKLLGTCPLPPCNACCPPEETVEVSSHGGDSSTGYTNAWQTIVKSSPYESYSLTSIVLYLDGNASLYVELYDTRDTSTASADPNDVFSSPITPVYTSSTVNLSSTSVVPVTFDLQGYDSSAQSTYYIWLKGTGTATIQFESDTSTSGGAGNNPGTLRHEAYASGTPS